MKPIIIDQDTGRELWRAHQCAEHAQISVATWRSYVSQGRALGTVGELDARTPLWDAEDVQDWTAGRPGQGTRTDLEGTPMTTIPDNRIRMACNRMKLRRYRTTDVHEGRFGRQFQVTEDPNGFPVDLTVTDLGPRPDGTPSDLRWGAEDGETDTNPHSTPDELADRLVEAIKQRQL
ncbi:hypothetical protein [Mycolicibacterium fortuitum]|uniref:hypothetical protein n=1 Tax=Mycolicibacterium fortuitum TaxID=1766 RepID=UPI00096C871D|nr:hypothetical protein A5734_01765 [Mycolicibacterium fortuitum]